MAKYGKPKAPEPKEQLKRREVTPPNPKTPQKSKKLYAPITPVDKSRPQKPFKPEGKR